MAEKTLWHKFFQEVIEDSENLKELSGKIIALKAREHQQMIRADFICHAESDIPAGQLKSIVRPFAHFKRRNVVEYKSFSEVLNENIFRYYLGRALCAENCDDVKYTGDTTLTILTLHKPLSLFALEKYKFEQLTPWKYRSHYIDDLEIYVLVQREMRAVKGGEALALLQIIESDKNQQAALWKSIFEQDLYNKDILKKIAEHINKEVFMSLVEEIKIEGKIEGRIEGKIEGRIEELLDNLTWTHPQIARKYETEIRAAKSEPQLDEIKKRIKAELVKEI